MNPPFESVLIANRGEIAVRVARTCKAMGIRTIAVYSDADARAPHVLACDVALRIGPAPARESYLRIDAIIEAARAAGAQAVHPGYGFLSENAQFAQACADADLVFVGPPPAAMRAMGDKIAAKKTVERAGVPTVPGYLADDPSMAALERAAKEIGWPVLVKAAAGGGGKGMRVVREPAAFKEAVEGARREAAAAFGDESIFLERYLVEPRHVEVQILADHHGACISLGERECSIQRRHQKVVEEAPSTAVSPALRAAMGAAAVNAALAVGYVNAGTVEFMLDAQGRYYFLEMNTRLQVEHPVTEAVTDIDIVRQQLAIASGAPLSIREADIVPRGHAIEVRVYAEDPANGFLPSIGRIEAFLPPEGPGLRNDAGVASGSAVTVDYDPMLAKLIAFDRTRDACVDRLVAALDDYVVAGVSTNVGFLRSIVAHPAFRAGDTTTSFLEKYFPDGAVVDDAARAPARLAAAGALQLLGFPAKDGPTWQRLGAWRHAAQPRSVRFADTEEEIRLTQSADGAWKCTQGEHEAIVSGSAPRFRVRFADRECRFVAWLTPAGIAVDIFGAVMRFALATPPSTNDSARTHRHGTSSNAGSIEAPMSGKIVKVDAAKGDRVVARQPIVVMEAMKMEHSVGAPYDGTVVDVRVQPGDVVGAGDVLASIESQA